MINQVVPFKITGLMVYYYFVCHRKLWYFMRGIRLEQTSELVQIGKIIDETTFAQEEKYIDIDGVINIDFIQHKKLLHEVKKSKAIEQASIWQVKYYLYYLEKRGVQGVTGVIHYPVLKDKVEIRLSIEDKQRLDTVVADILALYDCQSAPTCGRKKLCVSCAYRDFCFI